MKKLLMVFALGAMLGSCGDDAEESKVKSACECNSAGQALMKKSEGVTEEDEMKKLDSEMKALREECKDYEEEDYKDCK